MILSTKQQFVDCLAMNDQSQYIAKYKKLVLSSVYQPIFDPHGQIIGVEALVRIEDIERGNVRPDIFFHSDKFEFNDKMNVERLSRVIHIRNFARSKYRHLQLFLNVLPSSGQYLSLDNIESSLLSQRIKALNLNNSQLVMEVVELQVPDERQLQVAMNKLAKSGFHIAIDDFGVEASNRQRVEQLQPSIIKIDRSLMLAYMKGEPFPLMSGIHLARRVGAKLVVEGIETQPQLDAMHALHIDMYQGYYLATPKPLEVVYSDAPTEWAALGDPSCVYR